MLSRTHILVLLVCSALTAVLHSAPLQCPTPPPSRNFTQYTYDGVWYEIGKIQTAGGAFFEHNCVCTELIVKDASTHVSTDRTVIDSCRDKTPQGKYINVTGLLTDMREPGAWVQRFNPALPAVNYTVISLGENWSVEFDCGVSFGELNYCVHILSRTPEMNPSLMNELLYYANVTLNLNLFHLPFKLTHQAGCW